MNVFRVTEKLNAEQDRLSVNRSRHIRLYPVPLSALAIMCSLGVEDGYAPLIGQCARLQPCLARNCAGAGSE
jgi:hypothetical protein